MIFLTKGEKSNSDLLKRSYSFGEPFSYSYGQIITFNYPQISPIILEAFRARFGDELTEEFLGNINHELNLEYL